MLVIHVGLHKTGTTFLQRQVFPKIKNVNFVGPDDIQHIISFKVMEDKINIISSEFLTNKNFLDYPEDDPFVIAERLKILFPDAKIIVVFREKESWKKSLYNQYAKKYGSLKFSEWEKKIFKDLDFSMYEKHLKSLFNDVLVLDYNELKQSHKTFVKKICDFIGVSVPLYEYQKVNKSINERKLKAISRIDKWKIHPFLKKKLKAVVRDIV